MWNQDDTSREVFYNTRILRKPISGIISGYHQLSYILISPDDENPSRTVEISGKINVSPKFLISPYALQETFKDIFDPETFDKEIQGRVFSFVHGGRSNLKVKSELFQIDNYETSPEEHLDKINDQLMQQENTRTGLIFGPRFQYYPVSIDRFLSEIIDREFNA